MMRRDRLSGVSFGRISTACWAMIGAFVPAHTRKKRRAAGEAAAARGGGALGSVVAVDKGGDKRGVYADDALAKLRGYDAQRHVIAGEDDKVYVHIAQLV